MVQDDAAVHPGVESTQLNTSVRNYWNQWITYLQMEEPEKYTIFQDLVQTKYQDGIGYDYILKYLAYHFAWLTMGDKHATRYLETAPEALETTEQLVNTHYPMYELHKDMCRLRGITIPPPASRL